MLVEEAVLLADAAKAVAEYRLAEEELAGNPPDALRGVLGWNVHAERAGVTALQREVRAQIEERLQEMMPDLLAKALGVLRARAAGALAEANKVTVGDV